MKRKILYVLQCVTVILLSACSEDDVQSLQASFASDVQEITIGESVTFKDESMGEPTKWNWHFEGGEPETSILFSPNVVYSKPGVYSVTLSIGRGSDATEIVKEQYVTVNYPSQMTANFSVDKTTATNEDIVSFKDLSKGYPNEWLWSFIPKEGGRTITSTEQNPQMTFSPGTYTVKLIVKNPRASSDKVIEDCITVIDKNAIAADFGAQCRNTYAGGSIHFLDKTLGSVEGWEWTFEGGSPTSSKEQNPVVKYMAPGKYKVTLKAKNKVNTSTKEKAGYIYVISANNLVLYLPFDGDYKDAGPNQLHPEKLVAGAGSNTYNSVVRFSGESAECRFAAHFQGDKNNYSILSVPEEGLRNHYIGSEFTVSFWAKVSNMTAKNAVFHQGAGPGVVSADPVPRQSWFRLDTSGKTVVFCVEYKGKAGSWAEYEGARKDDGEWHHYVCVYQKVDGKRDSYLYIDGQKVIEKLGVVDKIIDNWPYYIGCNYRITNGAFAPENFLNGDLDDFILYSRILSEQEIQNLYNN